MGTKHKRYRVKQKDVGGWTNHFSVLEGKKEGREKCVCEEESGEHKAHTTLSPIGSRATNLDNEHSFKQ